ncbi:hypothetical protein ACHAPU_010127 [Fusarium lateritium]
MVRYASDGSLDFLGRRDGQVKLRGQRLELGEIGHHIQRFMAERADFREVSVQLFKPPSGGEPYLAALLVMDIAFSHEVLGVQCSPMTSPGADSNLQTTMAELKRNIRGVLPHYMVPSQFIAIFRLPMGPTGKLDNVFVKTCLGELMEQPHDEIQVEEQELSENAPSARETLESKIHLPARRDRRMVGARTATVAHAAWALTVSHYTGNRDVLFGATLSGCEALATSMDNLESVVGPTITTAPFRTVIDYSTIVYEFLTAVQKDVVRAACFGQMGIASITHIDKHCRAACQFRNIFVAQNAPTDVKEDAASSMVMRRSLESTGFIPVPLVMEVEPPKDESEMTVYLVYDADILGGKLPHFILDTFTTIVQNLLLVASDSALGQLPVLSSAHLSALISAASLGNHDKPQRDDRHLKEEEEECLDRLFRNQADKTPSAYTMNS